VNIRGPKLDKAKEEAMTLIMVKRSHEPNEFLSDAIAAKSGAASGYRACEA
jgi:hypothetical protein